jgi:hypothetical protein
LKASVMHFLQRRWLTAQDLFMILHRQPNRWTMPSSNQNSKSLLLPIKRYFDSSVNKTNSLQLYLNLTASKGLLGKLPAICRS